MVKEKFFGTLPCYLSFDFLEERPRVQPEQEMSQSCSFGARSMRLKVNTKSVCLQSRCAVKWVLHTDRELKAAWTLQNKQVI